MNDTVTKSLDLFGYIVRDRITGFTGVVTSVSFDLYGCVQAWVTPQVDKDGKNREGGWYDAKRLAIDGDRVMPRPNFSGTKYGDENGANMIGAPGTGSPTAPR